MGLSTNRNSVMYVPPALRAARRLVYTTAQGAGVQFAPLSAIASVVMGTSPAGVTCNQDGSGSPLLNGPTEFGVVSPVPVQWTVGARKFCNAGDLLFCVRGATTGRTNWADQRYAIGRGLAAIRGNKGASDTAFLYHMIRDRRDDLMSRTRGSTFMNMGKDVLEGLPLPALNCDLQHALGGFLGDVEDRSRKPGLWARRFAGSPFADLPRIVAKIDRLAEKIEKAHGLRGRSSTETAMLFRAAIAEATKDLGASGSLADVLLSKPRNGWSASCDNMESGIPVLSLTAVTGFEYQPGAHKRTSLPTSPEAHYWLKPDDLLMTRSNTPELVGHAAIYNGEPSPCIYPDLMMRLEVHPDRADKCFVWRWLQSPMVREYIVANAKGTSPTMKKISQGTVMAIPFPSSLELTEQRRIVAYLDDLQAKVDAIKALQAKTAAELDALLPSILDKAFKGKL